MLGSALPELGGIFNALVEAFYETWFVAFSQLTVADHCSGQVDGQDYGWLIFFTIVRRAVSNPRLW